MKKRNFKDVTKKLLASLLALAMICGIGPTYAVANAGATPEEVSVSASSRTDAGSSHLFFRTSVEQSSFVGGEMEYKAVSGGVYLDGSETVSNIDFFMRNGGSDFFIYFGWFNYAPQVGSTIQIDGTFKYTKGDHQLKVTSGVFTYDGTVWTYDDRVSAFETEVIEHSREDIADSHMFFMLADDDGKFVGGEMYYHAVSGGVYVNETLYTSVTFRRNGSGGCFFYFPESGLPTPTDGATLRFDGVFQSDASKLKLTSETFKYNAGTDQWTVVMPSFETEVIEYSREDIGTSHMFFATVDNDGKFAGGEMYYNAVSGGVYVNATLYTTVTFRRNGGAQYFIYFPESGLPTPKDGMTLRFDGEFQSGDSRIKLTSKPFVYDASTCQWTIKDTNIVSVAYGATAFAGYRADLSAPTAEGYVFAGWYADEECKTILNADTVKNVAYAKFVDMNVLTAKAQVTANIDEKTDYADMRFVTTVDSLNYREVGLYITIEGLGQEKKSTTTVYKQLLIVGEGATTPDERITPQGSFCKESQYFATYSYWNIPNKYFNTKFTVTPYWVTLDGTEVCGPEAVRTVSMVVKAESELTLVANGRTEYVIVRGENAAPAEVTAASELQDYLAQISGVTVPIVTDSTKAQSKEIVVGETTREEAGTIDRAKLGEEGFVIKTTGEKLWLTGGGERGTLYSAYAFLEDYLGCRFYTADVEKIPQMATVQIAKIKGDEQIPVFELRDPEWQDYTNTDISVKRYANTELWGRDLPAGVGDGISYAYGAGGHTFFGFVDPNTYFSSHPEYFSMNENGNRISNGQLCLTNANVLRLVIAGVRQWLAANPDADMISVSQNDVKNPCLCNNCKAVYNDEGGAYSGTLIRFVNAIAEDIREDYPNVIVDTFAYQYTRSAPTKTKPADNVSVTFCTIEGCFSHAHSENCAQGSNASYLDGHSNTITKDLTDWTAICKHLYVFDYSSSVFHNGMTVPNFESLQKNILFYAQMGVDGVRSEGFTQSASAELGELRSYLISKLLWDPYMSEEEYYAHMDDFLTGVYGPGGTYVREYIDLAEELTDGIHFNLTPEPHELYPLTYTANYNLPESLTVNMVKNYTSTDWTSYWNWYADVEENTITLEGKRLFEKAIQVAETDMQRRQLEKIYSQVEYILSYYYKAKIDAGNETFAQMIRDFIAAHASSFSEEEIATLPKIIKNRALAQLYPEYEAYNRALAEKWVQCGLEQYRSTYSISNWKNFNYANIPLYWSSYDKVVDLDTPFKADGTLWVETSSADSHPYNEDWSCKYWAYSGGIYVNGVKVDIPLIKLYNDTYIVRPMDYGYPLTEGMRITIDGVFGDGEHVTKFNAATFVYTKNSFLGYEYIRWIKVEHLTVLGSSVQGTDLHVQVAESDSLSSSSSYSKKYNALSGGVYVDGILRESIKVAKYSSKHYVILWGDYGITPVAGMKVTIDGIFGDTGGGVKIGPVTFIYTDDYGWVLCMDIGTTGQPDSVLWLQSGVADTLAHNLDWSCRYWAKDGNIYIDGVAAALPLIKVKADTYIVYFPDFGYSVKEGMEVVIDGAFTDGTNTIRFNRTTFRYDGTLGTHGVWVKVN